MNYSEKERQMTGEVAARTAQKIVQPKAAEIDATGEFPRDLVETFGKQGLLSIILPEEYGGTNGDIISFCRVIEEIAKVSGSSSLLILAQGVGSLPILEVGNSSQQERWLTRISESNHLAALALMEPGGTIGSIKTRSERQGGDYVINGQKGFVANGSVADLYTVFCLTDPGQGSKGLSAFVVEKGTAGLTFGRKEEQLGMRGMAAADVFLENCRVPVENRLGEVGEGGRIATKTLLVLRMGVGAQAVGLAQGALDFAIHYAKERIQFGKPIVSFQAIQFMIADMATLVETARALVYRAAGSVEAGSEDAEKLSAVGKVYASDAAIKITTDAVQILGGYGYMKDYPVERMMRDAKVTQIYGGSNQAQRQIIASHLIKD